MATTAKTLKEAKRLWLETTTTIEPDGKRSRESINWAEAMFGNRHGKAPVKPESADLQSKKLHPGSDRAPGPGPARTWRPVDWRAQWTGQIVWWPLKTSKSGNQTTSPSGRNSFSWGDLECCSQRLVTCGPWNPDPEIGHTGFCGERKQNKNEKMPIPPNPL